MEAINMFSEECKTIITVVVALIVTVIMTYVTVSRKLNGAKGCYHTSKSAQDDE